MNPSDPDSLATPAGLLRAATGVLQRLHASLTSEFGYAAFAWETSLEGSSSLPTVTLRACFARLGRSLEAQLRKHFARTALQVRSEPLGAPECRTLPSDVAPLFREHPRRIADASVSTELVSSMGPVLVHLELDRAWLVTARDGTTGWIGSRPGPPAILPPLPRPRATPLEAISEARRFLGTPYKLGGATRQGIDCSALVQQSLWQGLAVLVPRHSTDQRSFVRHSTRIRRAPGDLVFFEVEEANRSHVALVSGTCPETIIHASISRHTVIEEPLEAALCRAPLLHHIAWEELAEQQQVFAERGDLRLDL